MDKNTSRTTTEEERKQALRTYLCDHAAGAQYAIQLFEALKELHAETPLGHFAADQVQQVGEDLVVLEGLARGIGADDFRVKEFAGWLSDKLSRLKLAPLGNSFNTFEALEVLSLGILGKRALWRSLMSVVSVHRELESVDLATLIERAQAQYEATEKMRIHMAIQAFGGGN